MVHVTVHRNNFAAGEIRPDYFGRHDLNLHAGGGALLQNVDILPSGALRRRPGLRRLYNFTDGKPRLHKYIGKENIVYLLAFCERKLHIFNSDGEYIQTIVSTPWDASRIFDLRFAQSQDFLLICHPHTVPTKLIYRHDSPATPFLLEAWDSKTEQGIYRVPFVRIEEENITLRREGSVTGGYFMLRASANMFNERWLGKHLRFSDGVLEVKITRYDSPVLVFCRVIAGNVSHVNSARDDWKEAVFSDHRGWPRCACFHQGRLVFGGTPSRADNLWFSRSGDYDNFDLGDGSDDQAIDIALGAAEGTEIRDIVSARHLQIFTLGGEWVVSDEVITPSAVTAIRQTQIGINRNARLFPLHINGATIFSGDRRGELHEYIYTDIESAYLVHNLNRLAPIFAAAPEAIDYNTRQRKICCVMADGSMRVLFLYAEEKIIAWSRYETRGGEFIDYAHCHAKDYAVTRRYYGSGEDRKAYYFLEEFSADLAADYYCSFSAAEADRVFSGEEFHLFSAADYIITHDDSRDSLFSAAGAGHNVSQPVSAARLRDLVSAYAGDKSALSALYAGFPIDVKVEALPVVSGDKATRKRYRLQEAVFYVSETPVFSADTGLGFREIDIASDYAALELPEHPALEHRQVKLTGFGWRDIGVSSPWIIRHRAAYPFTLLSVEMRLSVH